MNFVFVDLVHVLLNWMVFWGLLGYFCFGGLGCLTHLLGWELGSLMFGGGLGWLFEWWFG